MKRGITFEIPNAYGRYLGDILRPFDVAAFHWYNGAEESYMMDKGTLGESLFPEQIFGMDGVLLKGIIENNGYYVIFADLKAFPKASTVINVQTYEEYKNSDCQLALLVVDSVYVTMYCKDQEKLKGLYLNASSLGYSGVQYITDINDTRTRLSV
ncbi:hypothetical protein C2I18_00635 [Paenibacillus sp. PK3_47]|uniref:DUF2691 family protein n=1 Tax=Paenibacillus sp. PK3_47 TaxID=2072642 RepID=UPI00201E5A17|nr:DUF2691 family protein [Paenibacillus sp. PK3_47]UQZ32186.1 hypothetical protein C2I18_00635 [Paenibacillus sp. PK3_47]